MPETLFSVSSSVETDHKVSEISTFSYTYKISFHLQNHKASPYLYNYIRKYSSQKHISVFFKTSLKSRLVSHCWACCSHFIRSGEGIFI